MRTWQSTARAASVALLVVVASASDSAELGRLACGCADCCRVELLGAERRSFVYSEQVGRPGSVWRGERYDAVAALPVAAAPLSNFDLAVAADSPGAGAVQCEASQALVVGQQDSLREVVRMENSGPRTCRVSWDGVFHNGQQIFRRRDLVVFFFLRALVGEPQNSRRQLSSCVPLRTQGQGAWVGKSCKGNRPICFLLDHFESAFGAGGIVIGKRNLRHLVLTGAQLEDMPKGGTPAPLPPSCSGALSCMEGFKSNLASQTVALVINLALDACARRGECQGYCAGCSEPTSTPLAERRVGRGDCQGMTVAQVRNKANCVLAGKTDCGLSPSQLTSCVDSINTSFEDGEADLGFLNCGDDDGLPSPLPTRSPTAVPSLSPTSEPTAESSAPLSVVVTVVDEDSPITLDRSEDRLTLEVEDIGMEPCHGRFVPMARLRLRVRMTATATPSERDLKDGAAQLDTVALARDAGLSQCTDETEKGGAHTCIESFLSDECLLVEPRDASCAFARLGRAEIAATYRYSVAGKGEETATLRNPTLAQRDFAGSVCPVAMEQKDLSADFPVDLHVAASSLNNAVRATIRFRHLGDDAGVTLRIVNVVATLGAGQGSLMQTFDIADKVALLGRPSTPFASDAHFCRYSDPAEPDVCTPFYDPATQRWNSHTEANYDRYAVPGRGFEDCQSVASRASDTFVFMPSNWVFRRWDGTPQQLHVRVVARVDNCQTASGGRRGLRSAAPVWAASGVVTSTAEVVIAMVQDDAEAGAEFPWRTVAIVGVLGVASLGLAMLAILAVRRAGRPFHRHSSSGKAEQQLACSTAAHLRADSTPGQ